MSCSHALPHRVNTALRYPLKSHSQRYNVILYGHESGIRIFWQQESIPERPNRETNGVGHGHREGIGGEPNIVVFKDISLGATEVLRLSHPPLPTESHIVSTAPFSLLRQKVVIAAACSDFSIKVLIAPLDPPQTSQHPEYHFQIIDLISDHGYQNLPDAVVITCTGRLSPVEEPDTSDQTLVRTNTEDVSQTTHVGDDEGDLLIAAHSKDLSGLLRLYRVPFQESKIHISTEASVPWRTEYLRAPALGVVFSPALSAGARHSRLLLFDQRGTLNIYDCAPWVMKGSDRWRVTLHTPFNPSTDISIRRRKSILDAAWIFKGKAILVLLSDGDWGIWDVEGMNVAKSSKKQALESTAPFASKFSVTGTIGLEGRSLALRERSSASNKRGPTKLAPMTPGTRKLKQQNLFEDQDHSANHGSARGGIDVTSSSATIRSRADDETILLWYGSEINVIPSLWAYWQNKVKGTASLLHGEKGRVKSICDVQLHGERIQQIVFSASPSSSQALPDLLVTAERRLITVSLPPSSFRARGPLSSDNIADDNPSVKLEESRLKAGDLELSGVDHMLDVLRNRAAIRARN